MNVPVPAKSALVDSAADVGADPGLEEAERPRVLVVDDDERNLLAIETVLEDVGEVVVARSGEEALRHLLKGEFAVILLDVYMPGLDGYETAQLIRQREQTKRIPIVFLSAVNKEAEHLMRGYAMGAVDYVFKPVDPVILRSKVAVFVDLFAKTKEIERKAHYEQALLDANLRANADRLKMEQELRKAESQLFQAQKMDAIGKLTGGIAHDFNNLLAAVLGGIGLLERRAQLGEEHQKILAMTRRAADQGTELVRRLLAFARRQQLQPAPVDVNSLHGTVDELMSHTLGGLVQLDWQIGEGAWDALADRSQLELALMNLIINARDAMPGGGTIGVSVENRKVDAGSGLTLAPGDYVLFTVSDRGCGIPEELIEQVLEPFFTTKEVGKGTGLGLSMVYGFARQSDGVFRIDSRVGEGTRAEIWLPRAKPGDGKTGTPEERHTGTPANRPMRILLVDDHAEVRLTTVGLLEELGHSVLHAASGAEALAMLEAAPEGTDLVISDYAMPHLSGMDVVRKVREARPGLPALIMTGYADVDEIGTRPDDVAVLLKPFDPAQLAAAVAQATAGQQSPA